VKLCKNTQLFTLFTDNVDLFIYHCYFRWILRKRNTHLSFNLRNVFQLYFCCIFVYSMDPDEVAAGCFEFRLRTRSFDLHQLRQGSKLKKFGRLFRASSDGGVKQTSSVPSSPAAGSSPRHSPPRRKRFVRVVRDKPEDCTEDGRYVVHKYSEAFLAKMNRERFVTFVEIQQKCLFISWAAL